MSESTLIQQQRTFFHGGKTKSVHFRKQQLKKLKQIIEKNENSIYEALKEDLNKTPFEAHMTELGLVYEEINYMLKHLKQFSKPKKVQTPIVHFYSKSKIVAEPLGSVLIISPWNFPINLSLIPLVGAMAAGNCAVLKPSEISPATSHLLKHLINDNFVKKYITVVEGEAETTQALVHQGFDYCFFTGSSEVGKEIMKSASEHLTPVTLELGGKSPAIIMNDANLKLAARRIVWGKYLNAGQTCVAPDHLLVQKESKEKLLSYMRQELYHFYGLDPLKNEDYPKIINEKHFNRIKSLFDNKNIIHGGEADSETLKIAPTFIDSPSWDSDLMQEEIFGPILPILTFDDLNEVVELMHRKPKPLALYLFTESKNVKEIVTNYISFGGGCINDTLIHLANTHLPFGGVGNSGFGQYHGKYSFETFSNQKSITEKTNLFDITLRYAPFAIIPFFIVRKLMK